TRAWEALEQAVIGKAVDLLSGPGGLAGFLRRRQLGARLGGPSLPLDIGYSKDIPAGIRNAVILRDKHCQWAGRCSQPAAACQVHHVKHKKNGGKTSTKDCVLLCFFHHQVVIHRWGWTLVLNPDGTTTAWNPDKTKVLHSHSPPVLQVQGRGIPGPGLVPLALVSALVRDADTVGSTASPSAPPASQAVALGRRRAGSDPGPGIRSARRSPASRGLRQAGQLLHHVCHDARQLCVPPASGCPQSGMF
ncbi:MAG: HNH endonuclease, partial [Streptosporangiaceae bacterium]